MITSEGRLRLLQLARQSILEYLKNSSQVNISVPTDSAELLELNASFVTLTINGELRGCVGHLQAIQPLYLDVQDNAINAAFRDSRFLPLSLEEIPKIKIEISVLSKPQQLIYHDTVDLLAKITPGKDGLIIKKGRHQATYLPQVWSELPTTKEFLKSLCQKATLLPEEWRNGKLEIQTYQAESFSE